MPWPVPRFSLFLRILLTVVHGADGRGLVRDCRDAAIRARSAPEHPRAGQLAYRRRLQRGRAPAFLMSAAQASAATPATMNLQEAGRSSASLPATECRWHWSR